MIMKKNEIEKQKNTHYKSIFSNGLTVGLQNILGARILKVTGTAVIATFGSGRIFEELSDVIARVHRLL